MSFVFGFVVGAAAVVVGVGAYIKHLEKTGQMCDFEDLVAEMSESGALVYVPEEFDIIPSGEEGKNYIEMDKIRLVVEDGALVGWYQHQ